MLPLLYLSHAAIGVFMLFTLPLPAADRPRLIRFGAFAGMAAAVGLFFFRGADASWGAATLRPGSAAVVAAAILCAWTLVAAVASASGRWDVGALVGAAGTGLALFAASDWVVPALLFWVVVSLATAASLPPERRSGEVWLALALSDACLVGGLVASSLEAETWTMPEAVEGWLLMPLAAAVILRTGVLAGAGIWGSGAGAQVALLPLVIASGFALLPSVSTGTEVAIALGLLLVAIGLAAWTVSATVPRVAIVGSWLSGMMLAVAWIAPEVLARAGVAAVLGVTAVALWPASAGRAQAERGLLLAAVPLTVGFGVVVGGAAASFERATTSGSVLESAPWSAFAALLPVALAAGVTMAAALARRLEPERYEPAAVLATWGIAAIALVLGISPRPDLAFSGGGAAATRGMWLYVVALAAAAAAARYIGPRGPLVAMKEASMPHPAAPVLSGPVARGAAIAAAVAGGAAATAVAWFTYTGLRNGFL